MKLAYEGDGKYGIQLSNGDRLNVSDAGPRATDLVLAGLATCSVRTFKSILAGMRLEIRDVSLRIQAERSEVAPRVFTGVRVTWAVQPGEAPPARVLHALDLTEKYCPVLQMVQKAAPVEIVRHIEGLS